MHAPHFHSRHDFVFVRFRRSESSVFDGEECAGCDFSCKKGQHDGCIGQDSRQSGKLTQGVFLHEGLDTKLATVLDRLGADLLLRMTEEQYN